MANDRRPEINVLILKYLQQNLDKTEAAELQDWLASDQENKELFERLTNRDHLMKELAILHQYGQEAEQRKLSHQIVPRSKSNHLHVKAFYYYAAAACVLILLSVGYWWMQSKKPVSVVQQARFKNDVQPGSDQRAVLFLDDGHVIYLDQAKDGSLGQQGSANVVKRGGELKYESGSVSSKTKGVTFNTLRTPKGGQYQLVLPDGSKVWLNAASSIHYPTAFVGNERRVEVSGEAYFEVTKDPSKPFRVAVVAGAARGEVEVLGTHFNVNGYANEEAVKTTLLEGKVKVLSVVSGQSALLKPGEQASIAQKLPSIPVQVVEVEDVVGWVNNNFVFSDLTIQDIMRQLARWYDVEVEYKAQVPEHFNATIQRNVPLSKVLQVLELTGSVQFEIEGKKITVKK